MSKIKSLSILVLITVPLIHNTFASSELPPIEGSKSLLKAKSKPISLLWKRASRENSAEEVASIVPSVKRFRVEKKQSEQQYSLLSPLVSPSFYLPFIRERHPFNLIFDSSIHRASYDYLIKHASSKKGHKLLKAYSQSTNPLPDLYDIRSCIRGGASFTVYNQGNLGSCTANAAAGAMQFCLLRDSITIMVPEKWKGKREDEMASLMFF